MRHGVNIAFWNSHTHPLTDRREIWHARMNLMSSFTQNCILISPSRSHWGRKL